MLQRDLSSISMRAVPFMEEPPARIFTSMERFLHLLEGAAWVDVMTYSVGIAPPRLKLRRILMCKDVAPQLRPHLGSRNAEIRTLSGIHVKLWLARFSTHTVPFVGSFNLGMPTVENVMCRVKEPMFWRRYFEHFWRQGKILAEKSTAAPISPLPVATVNTQT